MSCVARCYVAHARGLERVGNAVGRRADRHAGRLERRLLAGVAALVAHDDGAGMAHALAGRRGGAGDEGGDRLLHGRGVLGRLLLHARRRSRRPARRPRSRGSWSSASSASLVVVPMIGIAADADEGGDAEPGLDEVEAEQRAERAGARDHADAARLEHAGVEGRHEADEALARRDEAGGVGADHLRAALAGGGQHVHGVVHRDVLGQAHDLADAGLDARRAPPP